MASSLSRTGDLALFWSRVLLARTMAVLEGGFFYSELNVSPDGDVLQQRLAMPGGRRQLVTGVSIWARPDGI